MNKSKMIKLPQKIIPLPNQDKFFHESWKKGDDLLDFPHPSRICLTAKPNLGKTTIMKNILLRQYPPFAEVFVIHCDADYTQEYADLGEDVKMLSNIPAPESWEGKKKTLVIIDDVEIKLMNKDQKRNLDRLFGYVSTHKNISVMISAQDAFNLMPIVRRCCNVFILWKGTDKDSMATLARKIGSDKNELMTLFKKFCKKPRDSIWFDMTANTPASLRLNGYEIIKKENDEEKLD